VSKERRRDGFWSAEEGRDIRERWNRGALEERLEGGDGGRMEGEVLKERI
jgi:hypothetical protein